MLNGVITGAVAGLILQIVTLLWLHIGLSLCVSFTACCSQKRTYTYAHRHWLRVGTVCTPLCLCLCMQLHTHMHTFHLTEPFLKAVLLHLTRFSNIRLTLSALLP